MPPASDRSSFFELDPEQLRARLIEWGEPPFRWRQVWLGAYQRLAESPWQLSDLPLQLRRRLEDCLSFSSLVVRASARSADGGAEKLLLGLSDGQAIEAVLMRYPRRVTACLSTQVGCAMGCVFCATGQMGFRRNLTAGEIVEQAILIARRLARDGERLSQVVLMGMGEPFHNYEATLAAVDRLNDPQGFNLGARRFTISTVGLVPEIERFTREGRQVNLAVSLHAADDELRSALLPINRRYRLADLMRACRKYVEGTGRRLSFEWVLIEDVNDSPQQAEALAELLADLTCHVNLIPLNPTHRYPGRPTPRQRAAAFRHVLESHGIPCTVRVRRGLDIQAGCGQLATDTDNTPPPPHHRSRELSL